MQSTDILHTVTTFVARNSLYLMLAVLVVNMLQRRHQQHARNKRLATLYIASLILALMVGTALIITFELPDILFLPLLAALILIGYRFRSKVFPFQLNCRSCGERLTGNRILFHDSNTCEKCEQPE